MQKAIAIIVLGLMWCNVGFAEDKNARTERFRKQIIISALENDLKITGLKGKTADGTLLYTTDGIASSLADLHYFVSDLSQKKSLIEYVYLISISKQNSDINQSSDLIFKIEVKLKSDE